MRKPIAELSPPAWCRGPVPRAVRGARGGRRAFGTRRGARPVGPRPSPPPRKPGGRKMEVLFTTLAAPPQHGTTEPTKRRLAPRKAKITRIRSELDKRGRGGEKHKVAYGAVRLASEFPKPFMRWRFKVHRCFGAAAPKEGKSHEGTNDPAQGSMQSARAGPASVSASFSRSQERVLDYRCGFESGTPALHIAVLIVKDSKSSFQGEEVSGRILVWKATLKSGEFSR